MLEPYILIPSELEYPNGSSWFYYSMLKVYWSTKTFITRSIFNNYFANAVIRYLGNARAKYQNANFEAIIIYPHLKGHISPDILTHCAEQNIHVVVLQLHSLHLLQPFGQVLFRSMKCHHQKVQKSKRRSIITAKPKKILTACEL